MEFENILELLYGNIYNYEGTRLMKELFNNNEKFRNIIVEGIRLRKINVFTDELLEKIENQIIYIPNAPSTLELFKNGKNIGSCTAASVQVSYSFPDDCEIAGGVMDYLKGTDGSIDGSHTWIVCKNKIYDTTFMVSIDLDYAKKMGYKQENIYRPASRESYYMRKEMVNGYDLPVKGTKSK